MTGLLVCSLAFNFVLAAVYYVWYVTNAKIVNAAFRDYEERIRIQAIGLAALTEGTLRIFVSAETEGPVARTHALATLAELRDSTQAHAKKLHEIDGVPYPAEED